ncbi:hypothetical protein [Streptomyces stackebrandtii]|uniref:hypothetical protein n=1 Tax=Streptomyces stackebrandtii TaxID=3051177 RepID=UPI0028DCA5D8|nr:hypothetical protein [Streptomyces sp. DSM 40976]
MAEDLREAVRLRALWFYETQLRLLNYDKFRSLRPDSQDLRLDLISEQQPGGGPAGRLHLDSGQPVWTEAEASRHGAFDASLVGRMGDWLGAHEPRRLAERLGALRTAYNASTYASVWESPSALDPFPREHPAMPTEAEPGGERVAYAISRAELAAEKPWLIPELYKAAGEDVSKAPGWVDSLERYVNEFEIELGLAAGGIGGVRPPFDPAAPAAYRAFLAALLAAGTERPAGDAVKVRLLDLAKQKPEDAEATYRHRHSVATNGAPMGPVHAFPLSRRVAYWSGVVHPSLGECLCLKPNSDMGLCQLVRLLYRYGPLPSGLAPGTTPRWRERKPPGEEFTRFMEDRAADVAADPELSARFHSAATRLRYILEATEANPRSQDPSWSPLAGEILKQGLLSYKFWMDEKPRAQDNERLNKVKTGLGEEGAADQEMEFWSENHYIMFASSEYLLGQLWEDDTFQPCGLFAAPDDRTGAKTGAQRRERGRARVLKWLNNRLMFGWMEYNSSGYYREHLWALLNLADFALDDEVRKKAEMAVDLMLFDVARFSHRGSMGAAGGRSQFKSKSHGYDNGLNDVVEMLFGTKGVFNEGNAQVGASFASSLYAKAVPRVLLEIGSHPPGFAFTDRSRVSVTFDEAPKYGITWSQKSVVKDSLLRGYASKRARHFPHLAQVNRDIARTHEGYGAVEDDTVFFWGMSAFFNKQVVRNSLRVVHRFGLEKSKAFGVIRWMVETIIPLLRSPASGLADLPALVTSPFTGGDGPDELDEQTADDLSLLLEGSTRSRANIVTYRSPGAMLSTTQNFRYGQLNFQNSVQQATLNGAVNVFVTTGFGGFDIPDTAAFGAGALVGGLVLGPIGAVGGGIAAVVANNELVKGEAIDETDGPDWWTGYWALPRVVQHGGAAIMLSEFHDIQDFLAETGSHAWFPKAGFDQVVERRTSAYDDANFPLLDIGHIGAKGFWLFGKVVHPVPEGSTAEPEEGYVGVFSNKRPEWLTKESDPYAVRLEKQGTEGIWADPPDLFADKDWYVNGKNVWIVQVGSKSEFRSFQTFMDRVSSARVHVDDVGDLECTYDVPRPGEGSDRLRLTNGDGAEFELNGRPLATDLFPRFENPFVRGGLVEWGQRTYCLEWNGRTLLHDFGDFRNPVRLEQPEQGPRDAETIIALVIHLRTEDEAMEAFTVATATVEVGCHRLTTDQVVAAGPMGEDTTHDAEWIFLDRPVRRSPDMTVKLSHPASGGDPFEPGLLGLREPELPDLSDPLDLPDFDPALLLGPLALLGEADDPEWKASYSLKALMGDWRLRDCSVPFGRVDVSGDRRDTGPRPFAVRMGAWDEWADVPGAVRARRWLLARQPVAGSVWLDHLDLVLVDGDGELWHKRASCGMNVGVWTRVSPDGAAPVWPRVPSWAAVSDAGGRAIVWALTEGRLVVRVSDALGQWGEGWSDLRPMVRDGLTLKAVPLGPDSALGVVPGDGLLSATAGLCLTGADGDVYLCTGWNPGEKGEWERVETTGFDLAPGAPVGMAGECLVARSTLGGLWLRDPGAAVLFAGPWQELEGPGYAVTGCAVAGGGADLLIAASGHGGRVTLGRRRGGEPVRWLATRADDGWQPRPGGEVTWAFPEPGVGLAFATGTDGTVRSTSVTDGVWRPVGRVPGAGEGPNEGPGERSGGGVVTVCRIPGQIEVISDTEEGLLRWTWWS